MKEMKLWECPDCGLIMNVEHYLCKECQGIMQPCDTHKMVEIEDFVKMQNMVALTNSAIARGLLSHKMVEEKCHRCGNTKHLVYVSCCGKLACLDCVVDFGDSFICRECGKDFVTKEVKLVEVEQDLDPALNLDSKVEQPSNFEKDLDAVLNLDKGVTPAKSEQGSEVEQIEEFVSHVRDEYARYIFGRFLPFYQQQITALEKRVVALEYIMQSQQNNLNVRFGHKISNLEKRVAELERGQG